MQFVYLDFVDSKYCFYSFVTGTKKLSYSDVLMTKQLTC